MELDLSQQHACELGCTAPFGVITGGPGTGKTTTLRKILDELDRRGESYALAAPTGKAAKRMSEATGRNASTIHRLLVWQRDGTFARNENNPLEEDVIFIDESSMLDVCLGADLIGAVRPSARCIFIGDANQLPSVGPGRVLADLVESGAVPVARLSTVHRSAAESWICRNAPRVLSGTTLELSTFPDFRFFECDDAGEAARQVQRIVAMPEYAGAQVLSPQRTTCIGTEALNVALQAQLNPPKPGGVLEMKVGQDRILRIGDRVIQTVNNYTLGAMNGEVGQIVDVNANAGELTIDFGDRTTIYTKGQAQHLHLAYALTTHKCQGSEFPWVICIVHSAHTHMLTRQLFYTAITRAKKGVVLVGNRQGIQVATSSKPPPVRNTSLVARMKELDATLGGAAAVAVDDGQELITW